MIKLKTKSRKRKLIAILVVFVIAIVSIGVFNILRANDDIKNQQKVKEDTVKQELAIEYEIKLEKELLKQKIINAQNFVTSTSNDIQIIVLRKYGEYILPHDKTPGNNPWTEWINNSELTIQCEYKLAFSIEVKDIIFKISDSGEISTFYKESDITISYIEVFNILPITKKSIFGKSYKASEIIALQEISKDNIKAIFNTNENLITAKSNLEIHIKTLAKSFGINNISIN